MWRLLIYNIEPDCLVSTWVSFTVTGQSQSFFYLLTGHSQARRWMRNEHLCLVCTFAAGTSDWVKKKLRVGPTVMGSMCIVPSRVCRDIRGQPGRRLLTSATEECKRKASNVVRGGVTALGPPSSILSSRSRTQSHMTRQRGGALAKASWHSAGDCLSSLASQSG